MAIRYVTEPFAENTDAPTWLQQGVLNFRVCIMPRRNGLTYQDSGVDIDAGDALVERIKPLAAATARPGTAAGLGGFGAIFDPKAAGYADPLMISATEYPNKLLRTCPKCSGLFVFGEEAIFSVFTNVRKRHSK